MRQAFEYLDLLINKEVSAIIYLHIYDIMHFLLNYMKLDSISN